MSESSPTPNDGNTVKNRQDSRRENNVAAKLVTALVLFAVGAIAWWQLGQYLNIERLAVAESWLRNQASDWPVYCAMIAFLTYVIVTGLSLPFALLLSLTISWLLGFGWALGVISFGSTTGATLAMLASRYVLRDWVRERFGKRFGTVLSRLDKEGEWYLATLRLAPIVPFFAVNLLAGLSRIRVRDYFWISQFCMLPATIVYCQVGASLPGLKQLSEGGPETLVSRSLVLGLCAMAILPLAVRHFLRYIRREKTEGPTGTHRHI